MTVIYQLLNLQGAGILCCIVFALSWFFWLRFVRIARSPSRPPSRRTKKSGPGHATSQEMLMRQSHSEPPMQQYVPVFTQDPCGFSAKIVGLSPDDLDDEDFECLMAFVRKRMEERGLSEGLSVAMSIREGCICLRFRFFRSDAEGGEAQVHAAGGRRGTHEVSESWLPGTGAAVDGFEQGPAGSMAAPEPVTLHARATADRVTWTRPTEDARRDFAGSVGSTHWTEAGGSSMPGHGSDISGLTADELLNLLPARLRPQVLAITLIPNLAAQEPGPFTPRVPPTVLPSEGSILTLGLVRTVTLEMPQVASGSLVASTDSGTQRDSVPIVWSSYPARTKPLKILSVETEDPDPNSRALTGLCRVKVALPRPSPSGLLLLHACFQSRSPNSRASDSPNTTPMDTTASLHASDVRAGLLPVPRTERSFLVVPDKGLATELETCSAHDADSEPLPPQTLLHIKSDLLADLEASLLMLSTCLTSSPRSPHTQLNLAARAVGNMISFAHGRGMSLFSHALSVLQVECNELRRPYQLRWLPVLRFASDVVEHKYLASVLEPFATLQRNMVLQQCVVLHAFFLALGTGFSSLPIAHLDYLAATAVYLGLNWLLTARRDRCASPSTIPNILRSSSLKATEPEPPSAVSSVLLKRFVNSEAFLHLYCASLVLLHFTTHLRRVDSTQVPLLVPQMAARLSGVPYHRLPLTVVRAFDVADVVFMKRVPLCWALLLVLVSMIKSRMLDSLRLHEIYGVSFPPSGLVDVSLLGALFVIGARELKSRRCFVEGQIRAGVGANPSERK